MKIKDRLIEFIKYKNLNVRRFQKTIDVSESYVNNINKSIGLDVITKISQVYPELNKDWLLYGQGEMLINNVVANNINYVKILPLSAQGGCLNDFSPAVKQDDCETMVSPISGADLAIQVSGDSMSPEYPSGSFVLVKKINEKAFIDWGRCYVLDTCNGTVIKKVFPGDSSDCIRCVSANSNYPEFSIRYSDINSWWIVLMNFSLK